MVEPALLLVLLALGAGEAEAEATEPPRDSAELSSEDPESVEEDVADGAFEYDFGSVQRLVISDGPTRVSAETNSPGPERGGAPVRVFVDNTSGPKGDLELVFVAAGRGHVARRVVHLERGARRVVTLPLVGPTHAGLLTARGAGVSGGTDERISFPSNGAPHTVLSLGQPKDFEAWVGCPPVNSYSPKAVAVVVIPLDEAPAELAAYVGFDAVALPSVSALERLDDAARRALEAYASTGGVLVLSAPLRPSASLPLLDSTEVGAHAYGFGLVVVQEPGAWAAPWRAGPLVSPLGPKESWERGAGRALDALLPQAVAPVGRFVFIIGLFTLAIGPGSVLVARRRGASWLLVTIPMTALATCAAIVTYSVLVDGFTLHAASYGLTLLDGKNHRAITGGVNAYYANLSPREARYSSLTGLLVPQQGGERGAADLSWSDGLVMGSGFIPSRLYREWGIVSVEPTRARLTAAKRPDGWVVQNALGGAVRWVAVVLDGRVWIASAIADGAEVPLEAGGEASPPPPPAGDRFLAEARARVVDRPLGPREFLAVVDGAGFVPTGGLSVSLEAGGHLVRGEVEP